jgi:cytochrome c oxidase cbb3-type subunit 3
MSENEEPRRTTPEGVPIIEGPDGLSELDNPMPRWMTHIFWATVIFSLIYVIWYPGLGVSLSGWTQKGQYEAELANAPQKPQQEDTGDALAVALADPTAKERGGAIYMAQCAACHGAGGEGAIGPNLKDSTWLYGGTPEAIAKVIAEGAPGGMPAFQAGLSATQLAEITAFVHGLGGGQ